VVSAILTSLSGVPAAAQAQIDYSKLEIKTTNLGHGVYLPRSGRGSRS
jgi:hypothetical protein